MAKSEQKLPSRPLPGQPAPPSLQAAAEALKKGLVDGVDEWTAQDLIAGGYLARARTLMQEVAVRPLLFRRSVFYLHCSTLQTF